MAFAIVVPGATVDHYEGIDFFRICLFSLDFTNAVVISTNSAMRVCVHRDAPSIASDDAFRIGSNHTST